MNGAQVAEKDCTEVGLVEKSVTPNGERKYGKHPTQKPEGLMQHFVEILSNRGDVVLDPFMGSRVIIMTEANSSVKSKVLKLLPKLKTEETDGLCVA